MKTGSGDRTWVELEKPKPPRVDDHYRYWSEPPPERSERCAYWIRQFERGFRPNRRWQGEGYDSRAQWLGVYMWEYLNVLYPMLMETREETP